MMHRCAYLAVGLAVSLVGCASYTDQVRQLSRGGQCERARQIINANEHDPGQQAAMVGAIYADCDKNMSEAVRYWTLGARYGNAWAQQTLAQQRQPIPAPDLRRQEPVYAAPAAPVGPVTCTSMNMGGGDRMTRCY